MLGKEAQKNPSARMTNFEEIGDVGPNHIFNHGLNLPYQLNFRAKPLEPSKSVKVLKVVSDPRE